MRSIDAVLADGTAATLGPIRAKILMRCAGETEPVGLIHRVVRDTVAAHEQAIRDRFPRILRRVSGYNLDEFVPGLPVRPAGWQDKQWQFNLAKLIVGSEGTLAVAGAAVLEVVPVPAAQGLVVLSFATIEAALDRLAEIVDTGPVAVEMLDRMILDLAAQNPSFAHHLNFAEGRPAAVLAAQFYADSPDELADRAEFSPGSSRAGRACWPFASVWSMPPGMTSGKSVRRVFHCSWAWLATPSRSHSSKTPPSTPPASRLL